jgi:membrane associated rhomboid family serine protease
MVIPLHDDNPTIRKPYVTWALIAINVVVFLIGPISGLGPSKTNQCEVPHYLYQYGAVPLEMTENKQLPVTVDKQTCAEVDTDFSKNPIVSALTSMFLHGGWLHLLGNMLFLFIFGNNVEDRFGHVWFLLFYVAAGLIAAYGFAFANADSLIPLVGASGAIAGVLGAYLVMFPKARVTTLVPFFIFFAVKLPAWVVLGGWFLLQLVYQRGTGVSGSADVAYLAHVIGFALGLVVAAVFRPRKRLVPSW